MPRTRSIKPGFFQNEDLGSLPYECRLLYIGLWTQADRAGRLEDRPSRLKAQLFPYNGIDIDAALAQLAAAGLIVRYTVGAQRLIAIPTWRRHQKPHHRETQSELPDFSQCPDKVGASPDKAGASTDLAALVLGTGSLVLGTGRPQPGPGPGPAPALPGPTAPARTVPLLRSHSPSAAFDGPRVYVPHALHVKLLRLKNGRADAEQELFTWYATVSEDWSFGSHKDDEPGADMFSFWQSRYAERWPAAARAIVTPTAPTPLQAPWRDDCGARHASACRTAMEHKIRTAREDGEP